MTRAAPRPFSPDNVTSVFLPVIAVWEDPKVEEEMRKRNHSISMFFEAASEGILAAPKAFRFLDLTKDTFADPFQKCSDIILKSDAEFRSSRFVERFEIKGEGETVNRFDLRRLVDDLPWFCRCCSVLRVSPRKELTFADIPLKIYTFSMHGGSKVDVLKRFDACPALKRIVQKNLQNLIENFEVSFAGDFVCFKSNKGLQKCNLGYQNEELGMRLFPGSDVRMSDELFVFLSDFISSCNGIMDERIKANVAEIEKMSKRKQTFFPFSKKEKAQMAELELGAKIVEVVCASISREKEEFATLFLRRMRSLQNPMFVGLADYIGCMLRLARSKDWDESSPVEVIGEFYRFFKGEMFNSGGMKDDLLCQMVGALCAAQNVTREMLPTIESILQLPVIDMCTKAICYERLAGYCIKTEVQRIGMKFLYRAFVLYHAMGAHGHALRCAAFIHNIGMFSLGANPRTSFICGCNNVDNLTKGSEKNSRTCWNSMMLQILYEIAKLLRECNDMDLVPLMFIYLFCYAKNNEQQQNMGMLYLDAINARSGNKDMWKGLDKLTLPLFKIEDAVEVFDLGSPESFGYPRDEVFSHCLKIWAKKSRSMLFTSSAWKNDKGRAIKVVCGEKITFRFSGKRRLSSIPLDIGNAHLIVKEEKCTQKERAAIWTIDQDPPASDWYTRTFISPNKTDTEPEETIELTYSSLMFSSSENKIDLCMVCHRPTTFTVTGIGFDMWESSKVVLPTQEYRFECFDREPTLDIQCENFPDVLCDSEVHEFRIIIRNIGDGCAGRIMLMHDAPYIIQLPVEPSKTDKNLAFVNLLQDRNEGIRPNEQIEFKASIRGQSEDRVIHLVWLFEAQKPWTLKYYCQKFTVKAACAQKLKPTLVRDVKQHLKRLIFVDAAADTEPLVVKDAQVGETLFTIKPLRDGEPKDQVHIEAGQKKGLILEESGSNDVQCSSFVDNSSMGVVFGHVETRPLPFQHLVPSVNESQFRFQIEAPSQVSLTDKFNIVDVVLKIQNLSQETQPGFIVQAQPLKNGAVWTGIFSRTCPALAPGEVIDLNFKLVVVRPGIINISTFKIRCGDLSIPTPFSQYITVTKP